MFRLLGFRHNPYIGSFHRVSYIPFNSERILPNLMDESKTNPLVGLIRHSPSVVAKSQQTKAKKDQPLSRLALMKNLKKDQKPANFVSALKLFPRGVYSAVSASSVAGDSVDAFEEIEDSPVCAICMEKYMNGDEILTLDCSHCFHSECISKWFYHDCLNSEDMNSNFSCPHCRRKNSKKSDKSIAESASVVSISPIKKCKKTSEDGSIIEEGYFADSMIQIGQTLLEDGGYDFINDVGSEVQPSPKLLSASCLLGSAYLDCGAEIENHKP